MICNGDSSISIAIFLDMDTGLLCDIVHFFYFMRNLTFSFIFLVQLEISVAQFVSVQ